MKSGILTENNVLKSMEEILSNVEFKNLLYLFHYKFNTFLDENGIIGSDSYGYLNEIINILEDLSLFSSADIKKLLITDDKTQFMEKLVKLHTYYINIHPTSGGGKTFKKKSKKSKSKKRKSKSKKSNKLIK